MKDIENILHSTVDSGWTQNSQNTVL